MLIGLVSDTHGNRERTRAALDLLEDRGAEALLHAGDVTSPSLVTDLLDGWRAWIAVGNMDRDPDGLVAAGKRCSPTIPVDATHDLDVGSARIGLVHGHDRGRLDGMVEAGAFDLVVHGHTHEFRDERVGSTRIVNPGAVHRASTPSVCTYETEDDELERLPIEAGT